LVKGDENKELKAIMKNFNIWIKYETENKLIKELEEQLVKSGFNILGKSEHYFEPYGYTGLWLLSESHFAIHSFPEEDKIYIELTSCVTQPFENMKNYIKENKKCIEKFIEIC